MLFKVVIKFLLALSFVLGSHKLWAVNSRYLEKGKNREKWCLQDNIRRIIEDGF